jgi:hypothetical protein
MYSNKCSQGFGFNNFYVQSPCNFLIEDYTEIFYTLYKWNVLFSVTLDSGSRRVQEK